MNDPTFDDYDANEEYTVRNPRLQRLQTAQDFRTGATVDSRERNALDREWGQKRFKQSPAGESASDFVQMRDDDEPSPLAMH
jgi:hypothetical protein